MSKLRKKPRGTSSQSTKSGAASNLMPSQLVTWVLRQEDLLKAQSTEMEFVLHLGMGKGSVIPILMKALQGWHAGTNETTFSSNVDVLIQRFQHLLTTTKDSPCFQAAVQEHLLTLDSRRADAVFDVGPAAENAQTFQRTTSCSRGCRDDAEGASSHDGRSFGHLEVPFFEKVEESRGCKRQKRWHRSWTLVVSNLVHFQTWHTLRKLCYHSVWQRIVGRIRPATMGRSPFAQQVAKHLN